MLLEVGAVAELFDQHGYIFRIGIGGYVRYGDILIKPADVDVFVNDARWGGVQYIEVRAADVDVEARYPRFIGQDLDGATGALELSSRGEQAAEPTARILALTTYSVIMVAIRHPDTGDTIRRITLQGCRWDAPMIQADATIEPPRSRPRWVTMASFKADSYQDEITMVSQG